MRMLYTLTLHSFPTAIYVDPTVLAMKFPVKKHGPCSLTTTGIMFRREAAKLQPNDSSISNTSIWCFSTKSRIADVSADDALLNSAVAGASLNMARSKRRGVGANLFKSIA